MRMRDSYEAECDSTLFGPGDRRDCQFPNLIL